MPSRRMSNCLHVNITHIQAGTCGASTRPGIQTKTTKQQTQLRTRRQIICRHQATYRQMCYCLYPRATREDPCQTGCPPATSCTVTPRTPRTTASATWGRRTWTCGRTKSRRCAPRCLGRATRSTRAVWRAAPTCPRPSSADRGRTPTSPNPRALTCCVTPPTFAWTPPEPPTANAPNTARGTCATTRQPSTPTPLDPSQAAALWPPPKATTCWTCGCSPRTTCAMFSRASSTSVRLLCI
mmetsp:Transcript_10372/g.19677  ORF Transcript_10372/g.19677 Transcript_10372/m.19677 type:complete len:240 (+) Transcript_10372:105-824(+)